MKRYILTLCIFCTLGLEAQTLTEARTMFTNEEYETAMPVFAKELKRKPNDATLNYWYGVCLYKTGEQGAAIPHLVKGEKGKIKEASYYLAEYAFTNFNFDDCLKHLDIYIMYATGKHSTEIARMLKTCEKVNQMTQNVENVVFLDSIIVPEKELIDRIKLHPACGTILLLDNYSNKIGISRDSFKYSGYAYATEKQDQIYFSDSTADNGTDLFVFSKLLDGWERENIPENLNQKSNECHPYLLSDGITIFFASDGYNSIGGFDLYISRYNAVTGSYFNPEPLPMPFNSPYNDYFYIIDEQIGRGYLVSDRNQTADSLIIYTFLPNEVRRPFRDKTKDELKSYARIASIAATQNGLNTDSILAVQDSLYLEGIRTWAFEDQSEDEAEENIDFFVRDGLIYTSEEDFLSEEAKINYRQYLKMKNRHESAKKELEILRGKYDLLSNDDPEKKAISEKIIQTEWTQLFLERDIPLKEYKIRDLEINELKNYIKE